MKEDQYFFGVEGEALQGPLELAAIRAAVDAGRLSPAVQIARDVAGPWSPLIQGRKLPSAAKPKAAVAHPLCFVLGCFAWVGFIAAGLMFIAVIASLDLPARHAAIPGMIVSALALAGGAITLIWMSTVITLLSKIAAKE